MMELIKVKKARYVKELEIAFEFTDGTEGILNLYPYLRGEVFEPLKDIDFFKGFQQNYWTIEWPNGADFAPEFLHELAKKKAQVV